jgi:hypothetical protein
VDWQNLRNRLVPVRRRWDLAVLANLADSDGGTRPADLIKAINAQSADGHIGWKVLETGCASSKHPATSRAGKCRTSPARPGTGCFPTGAA